MEVGQSWSASLGEHRMERSKRLLRGLGWGALLTSVVLLLGCSGCSSPAGQAAEAAPTAGSSLNPSSLKLVDLDGKSFDLTRASEGRVHVVVFTRSDCPVSNQFAPEVRGLYEKLHPQGVDF